jgi:hypothetical protein
VKFLKINSALAMIYICLLEAAEAPTFAQTIQGPVQIIDAKSTIRGGSTVYTLPQIRDGISSDNAPFNGFQGRQTSLGKITFILNGHYDLTAFYLWNDVNVRAEGVRDFNLVFLRSNGLTNTVVARKNGNLANPGITSAQVFSFPKINDVSSIEMVITSVHNGRRTYRPRVEIREVAFDGVWFCGGSPTTC